jgi:hypothetical protein
MRVWTGFSWPRIRSSLDVCPFLDQFSDYPLFKKDVGVGITDRASFASNDMMGCKVKWGAMRWYLHCRRTHENENVSAQCLVFSWLPRHSAWTHNKQTARFLDFERPEFAKWFQQDGQGPLPHMRWAYSFSISHSAPLKEQPITLGLPVRLTSHLPMCTYGEVVCRNRVSYGNVQLKESIGQVLEQ